jgi:hypothetical protein
MDFLSKYLYANGDLYGGFFYSTGFRYHEYKINTHEYFSLLDLLHNKFVQSKTEF